MGKVYRSIDENIRSWIADQHVFFVATAPLASTGSVNLSPKGKDTLRVIDARTLAFVDTGGSGIETVAHLRENGRIVIMMCAFAGQAKIYRFHGTGTVVIPGAPSFDDLAGHFDLSVGGIRSIVRVDVARISDSCGYGVPLMTFTAERNIGEKYLQSRGVETVREYLAEHNAESIDGLPGISAAEAQAFRGPIEG